MVARSRLLTDATARRVIRYASLAALFPFLSGLWARLIHRQTDKIEQVYARPLAASREAEELGVPVSVQMDFVEFEQACGAPLYAAYDKLLATVAQARSLRSAT